MTPREPDRFDKQAEGLTQGWGGATTLGQARINIAAALRAEHASALERAAQSFEANTVSEFSGKEVASILRVLRPPAPAPAAERCPQGCDKPAGHEPPCGEHVPAAERQTCVPCQGTGRRQGGGGWGRCPDCNGHGTVVVARAATPEREGKT